MEIFENQQDVHNLHWYLCFPTPQKQPLILSFIRMTRRLWIVWCDICRGQVIKIFLIDTSRPLPLSPSQTLFLTFQSLLQNVDQHCVGTDWAPRELQNNTSQPDRETSHIQLIIRCWSRGSVHIKICTHASRGVIALVYPGLFWILFPVGLWQFVESVSKLLWWH